MGRDREPQKKVLRPLYTDRRVWNPGDAWTPADSAASWILSDRMITKEIGRSIRLPTGRAGVIRDLFKVLISAEEFRAVAETLDDLAEWGPGMEGSQTGNSEDSEVAGDDGWCLGHSDYAGVVHERCRWGGGLDALRAADTFICSDGSYDQFGSGAWGLVVCQQSSVKLSAGRVDPGPGTNSSYRSEAYGLLAGMRWTYHHDVQGDILHVLDNEAVTRVFQNCMERGPSLVCSQDVWDEIIWLKGRMGERYRVEWRRGHAEDRGSLESVEDRANHLADGLAKAGYEAAFDLRRTFSHGRRWHIRLGGLRHFDDVLSSVREFLGDEHLCQYYVTDTGPALDLHVLRAFCMGKSTRSQWNRAENAKFVYRQLATLPRMHGWGLSTGVGEPTNCRACGNNAEETVSHLVTYCLARACVRSRRSWWKSLQRFLRKTAADLADLLQRRLQMTADGCLMYDGETNKAAQLVTGRLPTELGVVLRRLARSGSGEVCRFVRWLRRSCSRELWWPTWAAAGDMDKAELGPVVEGQASRDEEEDGEAGADEADDGVEDETGYDSDKTEGGAG